MGNASRKLLVLKNVHLPPCHVPHERHDSRSRRSKMKIYVFDLSEVKKQPETNRMICGPEGKRVQPRRFS